MPEAAGGRVKTVRVDDGAVEPRGVDADPNGETAEVTVTSELG